MTNHTIFNAPHTPPVSARHSIIDTFMACPRGCGGASRATGAQAKTTTKTNKKTSNVCLYMSYLSTERTREQQKHTLLEAITFECQKIILAVIFSNIRATAKATNGHGGEKGNDSLLPSVTVHDSTSNIFSRKSLRSFTMHLAWLIYVF